MDTSSHIKEPSNEHNSSLLAGSNATPTPDHEPTSKIKIDKNSSKAICKHPQACSTPEKAKLDYCATPTVWSPVTKLGKAVSVVLGKTTDVEKLDLRQQKYKNNPMFKHIENEYLDCSAVIQLKVCSELKTAKANFKNWESEFFNANNLSPSSDDILKNKLASRLMEVIKYSHRLLIEWRINI